MVAKLAFFSRTVKRRRRQQAAAEPIEGRSWRRWLPEAKDVFLFGGVGLIGYGFWTVDAALALIIVGGFFTGIGFLWYANNIGGPKDGNS